MTKSTAIVLSVLVLAGGTGLILENQNKTRLSQELLALQSDVQQLASRMATLQRENRRRSTAEIPVPQSSPPESQWAELMRLRAEIGQLSERTVQLEQAAAAVSNQMVSASGANAPFVYPDSIRRKDYAFSGFTAPQPALQSMFWALAQSDPRAYQASITSRTAEMFANAIKDLPEGVMPGGYKNGALYRASGFRVLEETALSDEETRLKVFLEGRQNMVLKLVFQKIGNEWKLARTEF